MRTKSERSIRRTRLEAALKNGFILSGFHGNDAEEKAKAKVQEWIKSAGIAQFGDELFGTAPDELFKVEKP